MDYFFLVAIVFPAWLMAVADSPYLVAYLIATWAFGPEVRRLNDWFGGVYQSVTVLSLLPQLATASLVVPTYQHFSSIPKKIRIGMGLILAALAYGTGIGIITQGIGAAIEGLGLLLPTLFVLYAAGRPYLEEERDVWLRSLFTTAVLVSAYAWYQFLTAPAWDMMWMMGSGMYASTGNPVAMGFRPFSTLNSAGPQGLFIGAAMVIGICSNRWRGTTGILGVLLVGSCLLLNQVRTAWIMVILAVATFVALSRRGKKMITLLGIAVAGVVLTIALPMLPGASVMSARIGTLGDLNDDNSARARFSLLSAAGSSLTNPFGSGFGSTGVGAKITDKDASTAAGMDNGYLDLFTTLGLPMTLILLVGIYMIGKEAGRPIEFEGRRIISPLQILAIAMLVAYAAGLFAANILGGVSGVLLWLTVACALRRADPVLPTRSSRFRQRALYRNVFRFPQAAR